MLQALRLIIGGTVAGDLIGLQFAIGYALADFFSYAHACVVAAGFCSASLVVVAMKKLTYY